MAPEVAVNFHAGSLPYLEQVVVSSSPSIQPLPRACFGDFQRLGRISAHATVRGVKTMCFRRPAWLGLGDCMPAWLGNRHRESKLNTRGGGRGETPCSAWALA